MSDEGTKGDYPRDPGVRFPPPLLFIAALGAGILLHQWFPLQILPSQWRFVGLLLGWLLVGCAAGLSGWAMTTFLRGRTSIRPDRPASKLVTWGPYRLSRNPMYIALSSLHLGVSILVNTSWPVLFLPMVWVFLYFSVIRREERYLAAAFGNEYESYCSRVRRWL